jgi:BirA family biotin operon repressor/biotin-[acetyl-CoA-carboxylase] ligase
MGKSWFSPAGTGLWFSIILRPYLPPSAVAPLTILTAVSLARAVSQICAITPLIKWPNDLITNGKKFAGILAEASVAEGAIKYVVVGVGVNVNIPARDFPEELTSSATSLMVETHKTHDRARLLGKFLSIFESNYLNYNSGVVSLGELLADIETLRGETVEVVDFPRTGDSIIGRVLEYAEDGSLSLRDEQGAIHHINSGSLRLLPA